MRGFFKIVFATLLALVLFTVIGFFVLIGIFANAAASVDKPTIGEKAVLVLDLSKPFPEQYQESPFALFDKGRQEMPSLYEVGLLLQAAKKDSAVKGLMVLAGSNANGFAASEELRQAVVDFKSSGKFVMAHAEVIGQKAYYVAAASDKVFCHPQGGVEWTGFSANLFFLKNMLDKLEIEPQIFYAGKFKSATEPLREKKMTEANREQTQVWLGKLYDQFLYQTAKGRNKDSAYLRQLAVKGSIQTAQQALAAGLVDGTFYDDQVKSLWYKWLRVPEKEKINFVSLGTYKQAADYKTGSGKRIALVFADGDIVSGEGMKGEIGSDAYKNILRKIRFDEDIKAVVFRVNSPGGSALASDVIWREISLLKKQKPVVVSMGDVAASGGYYIACNADRIYAQPNTITGSIGVFTVIPNFSCFLENKIGISFDGVKTAPYADMVSAQRPLTPVEKTFVQAGVDSIYHTFKTRVAEGRKASLERVDSLAQGRVWTGLHAQRLGLVDEIGGLNKAIEGAARLAKLKTGEYKVREYPEPKSFLEQIMEEYQQNVQVSLLGTLLSPDEIKWVKETRWMKKNIAVPQTRLPFQVSVQ